MINHPVFRMFFAQILIVVLITLLCGIFWGLQGGLSAMLGGIVVTLANCWSYCLLTTQKIAENVSAEHTLRRYYRVEASKYLCLLLVLALLLKPEQPLVSFGWELNKALLIVGFVATAIVAAVPNALMLSRQYSIVAARNKR